MKKITLFTFLLFHFLLIGQTKTSFEGLIKFSTEVTISNPLQKKFKDALDGKYGDSLIIYYSKTGNFKRVYLNSALFGNDSQFYIAKKGKLYLTNNLDSKIDSLDVTTNSLKLISKQKISNEKILNFDCECYEYKATSIYNQNIILTYCFSSKTPSINHQLYSKHKDFYLNDFFKSTQKPYLKFSIRTTEFAITYLATEIIEQELDQNIFQIKNP